MKSRRNKKYTPPWNNMNISREEYIRLPWKPLMPEDIWNTLMEKLNGGSDSENEVEENKEETEVSAEGTPVGVYV